MIRAKIQSPSPKEQVILFPLLPLLRAFWYLVLSPYP